MPTLLADPKISPRRNTAHSPRILGWGDLARSSHAIPQLASRIADRLHGPQTDYTISSVEYHKDEANDHDMIHEVESQFRVTCADVS